MAHRGILRDAFQMQPPRGGDAHCGGAPTYTKLPWLAGIRPSKDTEGGETKTAPTINEHTQTNHLDPLNQAPINSPMHYNPNKKFTAVPSGRNHKRQIEQDVFDQPLDSMDDFQLPLDEPKKIVYHSAERFVNAPSLNPPPHAFRRAIQELESCFLNELLLQKLLALDRDSAEFRQEYVRLRAESLVRPRPSSSPWSKVGAPPGRETIANTSEPQEQIAPEEINLKSPWSVHKLRDLWIFFGPWLTVLIVLQLYYSYKLGALFEKQKMLYGSLPFNMDVLIIALASLLTSSLVLKRCKGQHYTNFIPRLLGIGIVSAVIAFTTHFLLMFL